MAISPEMRAAIRRMFYAEHHRIRSIADHFGIHYSTVNRALNQDYKRMGSKLGRRKVLVDVYVEYITSRLEKHPKIKAKLLFYELKNRGYQGSYNTVLRYVRRLRPKYQRAYIPIEVIPGEEAQVDWAHIGSLEIDGATRKVYCFVMTLSWSRASWVDLTMDMTSETLLRCHTRAFSYFGGIPTRVSYDNMRTVVTERFGDIIRFHKGLLEYASWYCYEPYVCAPYQPQQKGRVERFIRFMRDSFFSGHTLENFDDTSYQLRLWLFQANKRPWTANEEFTVENRLEVERKHLRPPPQDLMPKGQKTVRSGKVPFIRFDLNQYSVDPKYTNQVLTVLYDEKSINIMAGELEVGSHTRNWGRGKFIRSKEHAEALFSNMSKGQVYGYHRHILQDELAELEDILKWCQSQDIAFTKVFRTLSSLREDYGLNCLKDAVKEALDCGRPTPEMIAVICRRLSAKHPSNDRPLALPKRAGVSDLTIQTHDLSGYDDI